MKINIIKNYIDKLSRDDLNNFFINQNINLSDSEKEYAYYIVKNKYENIINNDKKIFEEIKKNINQDAYIKLFNLYDLYSKFIN